MLQFLIIKMLETATSIYTGSFSLGLLISILFYFVYTKWLMIPCLTLVMKQVHPRIEIRKKLLFKEAISNIRSYNGDHKQRTEILEIGVGAGQNFVHFTRNSNVHLLDKTCKFTKDLASK